MQTSKKKPGMFTQARDIKKTEYFFASQKKHLYLLRILFIDEMAIIRMTAQKARDCVKENNAALQVMYDAAPFADEDPNPDAKPVARGFAAFREYIGNNDFS
jgi:hypothetical protein